MGEQERQDERMSQILLALPKTDLHVHLIGCVRASTLEELAARHGVPLPLPASDLYARINSDPTPEESGRGPWFPLLRIYELIGSCLREREDFARVTYEALEDGLAESGTVYQELAISPTVHLGHKVAYATVARGVQMGIEHAREALGVDARVIAAINREDSPASALALVDEIIRNPIPEVVAVGLDFDERKGPPQRFIEAFRRAGTAGLHRTAHAGEHVAGAANVLTCLDELGCERIDHGYHILRDPAVVSECRRRRTVFNVALTTSRRTLRPWRRESVREMLDQGLRISLNSDDPKLFPTTLANEFEIARRDLGLRASEAADILRNGIDAAFCDKRTSAGLSQRLESALREAGSEWEALDHGNGGAGA